MVTTHTPVRVVDLTLDAEELVSRVRQITTSRTGYAVRGMFVIVGSILLAVFVVRGPEGRLLVLGALLWEVAEKLVLLRYSKRMPPAVGREALIGLPVTAVSTCQPEGWVRLGGERWKAHCSEGAGRGDSLVVEAVEQITLIVAQPLSPPLRA